MQEALIYIVLLAVAAGAGWYWFKYKLPQEKAAKEAEARFWMAVERAETKVKVSDPIDRADIELLERAHSRYFNDAVALRRQQEFQRQQREG